MEKIEAHSPQDSPPRCVNERMSVNCRMIRVVSDTVRCDNRDLGVIERELTSLPLCTSRLKVEF